MKVGAVVKFNDEQFFEGAVQLSWLDKRPEQAKRASESFVFHGPRYHGANQATYDGIDSNYRLKDTASFVRDLLGAMLQGHQALEVNPFWLVVAGYGSGKSHLALTCSSLLSAPTSDTTQKILQQLKYADSAIGEEICQQVAELPKPALVLPLDGMSGFHLGNALSQAVFKQLHLLGIDPEPIRNLSPRFKTAIQFVERNYSIRQASFNQLLAGVDSEQICQKLHENDELTYEIVDAIYTQANGLPIPVEGQESAQELIDILCSVYCAADGPFSHIIIMFDEFGRYLEYAAERPNLAGDAALQQIFQGIQDHRDKIHFIGFIQYELKAYLKRFSGSGLRQLQRYITRFDTAQKWYLSTNLETIFAHMIHKDETALDQAWELTGSSRLYSLTHSRIAGCLPGFERYPVWLDPARFTEVIGRGCWPLHPLAVWLLTRQKDVVQSRSALTFIKDIIAQISDKEIVLAGQLKQVSAADLILRSILPELVAAEREAGGAIAETLQTLLEKFSGHFTDHQQLVLAGVASLEKMRIGKQDQANAQVLVGEATALDAATVAATLGELFELGVLEWNRDLGQYELLVEGASRGQFQQWLRKLTQGFNLAEVPNLFMRRAARDHDLVNIETDFGRTSKISTPDWFFEASLAHSGNLGAIIQNAFKEWSLAELPSDPKGKVIYLYLAADEDKAGIEQLITESFTEELARYKVSKAPIWIIGIEDRDAALQENLIKQHLFEEKISDVDKDRFRRFISDEVQRAEIALKNATQSALKLRQFWVAGFEQVSSDRLKVVGHEIFSATYTRTIPFVFDGFASKNGTAKADCAQLMRGLIVRQVDGNWVQSQRSSLQNRVATLMADTWGALLPSGSLVAPRESAAIALFSEMVQMHQDDPSRSLHATYTQLLHPPHGMNSASAGLFISLLVGLDIPPRRLEHEGKLIAPADWVGKVFKKSGSELQSSELKNSTLRFLSEDSESQWRGLLARWETAQAFQEKLDFFNEAIKLHKIDPMPESLEGKYSYLSDNSVKIRIKLDAKKKEIADLERKLEGFSRNYDIEILLSVASKLQKIVEEFESGDVWPASLFSDVRVLLEDAQQLLLASVGEWIPRQICNSIAILSDFREKQDKHIRILHQLGFERQAVALQTQVTSSISRVEKIQAYKQTLDECTDYPRQPAPTALTLVRELRDEMSKGDHLITTIRGASGVLSPGEIESHIRAINSRQVVLKEAEKQSRNQLVKLYETPQSESEFRGLLHQARHLLNIFIETRDEQEISEIIFQIEKLINNIDVWPSTQLSAARLDELLSSQIEQQVKAYENSLKDAGIDEPVFGGDILKVIAKERIQKAHSKSLEWTATRLKSCILIDKMDLRRCAELQLELHDVPAYLSADDFDKIESLVCEVNKRIAKLQNEKQRSENQAWLHEFPRIDEISLLNQRDTEYFLKKVKESPHELSADEAAMLQPIEHSLHSHIDQITISGILDRIAKLPRSQQLEIMNKIDLGFVANNKFQS